MVVAEASSVDVIGKNEYEKAGQERLKCGRKKKCGLFSLLIVFYFDKGRWMVFFFK